jgi:hypothetical protein
MITGVHAIVYARDAARVRAFFRDVLEFPSVDAGHGWLIFALPPAEAAAHPTEGKEYHELYLMCDDVLGTVEKLKSKGVRFTMPIADQGWGLVTRFELPGGGIRLRVRGRAEAHPTELRGLVDQQAHLGMAGLHLGFESVLCKFLGRGGSYGGDHGSL